MLLNTYEARNLLCNLSFNGTTSQADTYAFRGDLAPGIRVLFYVENLGKALQVDLDGVNIILLPHPDGGAVWNTLMDDLRLDKDDFKGQSAEDKVITVYEALVDYQPKLDSPSYEEALGFTVAPRRAARGPV